MKRRLIPFLILILILLTMKLSYNFLVHMKVVTWNRPIVVDDLNFTVLDVTEDPPTAEKRYFSAKVRIVSQARRAS